MNKGVLSENRQEKEIFYREQKRAFY